MCRAAACRAVLEGVAVEVGVAAALVVCVEVGVIRQVFAHLPHLRSDGLARFDAGAMFQRHHNAYQGVFAFLGRDAGCHCETAAGHRLVC